MAHSKAKAAGLARRRRRVRGKIHGTAERPRMCVSRSNSHIYVQLIDDEAGHTLVAASSIDSELRASLERGSNVEAAKAVGKAVGERAIAAGIKRVVFDRSGHLYHGRVRAVAEGAREAGLEF
ncbi:MAG: 50S ribosomal protein L18 [Coriobacteriia bacterium]